jgi:hypothetical protein
MSLVSFGAEMQLHAVCRARRARRTFVRSRLPQNLGRPVSNMADDVASVVSETDALLFAQMSNPSKVNLSRMRSEVNRASHQRLEEIPEDSGGVYPPQDDDYVAAPPSSPATDRVDDDHVNDSELAAAADVAVPEEHHGTKPCPSMVSELLSEQPVARSPFFAQVEPSPPISMPAVPPPPSHRGEVNEEELLEKQQALLDLERLRMTQGVTLSKRWTLDDRLDDMQFEVRRHLLHAEEQSSISMLRDGLRLATSGIEMGSARFGILDLEGWSNEVCADMSKYDHSLSRLYRKYFQRGFSSPETELALALVGSMSMFHFKQKLSKRMLGGMRAAAPPAMPRASPAAQWGSADSDEEAPP